MKQENELPPIVSTPGQVHEIIMRWTDTGNDAANQKRDPVFKQDYLMDGSDEVFFGMVCEAIHQNAKLKKMLVHALAFDGQHDFENCPDCKKNRKDPDFAENLSDPLVGISERFFSSINMDALRALPPEVLGQRCRVCGCTNFDCRQCIEKTGEACYWVEDDLCSACVVIERPGENRTEGGIILPGQF